MTSGTCDAAILLDMAEHNLCMECKPPTKPGDSWFAPLYCDLCKEAKQALFATASAPLDDNATKVVICIQNVSGDGTKTELARTPFTRVIIALPKYLERYIGYDGCVGLPEYFKTRIVRMSPVDGELNEVVTVTANVMDVPFSMVFKTILNTTSQVPIYHPNRVVMVGG